MKTEAENVNVLNGMKTLWRLGLVHVSRNVSELNFIFCRRMRAKVLNVKFR